MRVIQILIFLIAWSNVIRGQDIDTRDSTYMHVEWKYRYEVPIEMWDTIDSTRNLDSNTLLYKKSYLKSGKLLKEEHFNQGVPVGGKEYLYNDQEEYVGYELIENSDTTNSIYHSTSIHGTLTKFLNQVGLADNVGTNEYKDDYNSRGQLTHEWTLNEEGDTIKEISHYYTDSGGLLRTETYMNKEFKRARIYLSDGMNKWSKQVLINKDGDITSSDLTTYDRTTEGVTKSHHTKTVFDKDGNDREYVSEVIWYRTERNALSKYVRKNSSNEVVVNEYKYEYRKY